MRWCLTESGSPAKDGSCMEMRAAVNGGTRGGMNEVQEAVDSGCRKKFCVVFCVALKTTATILSGILLRLHNKRGTNNFKSLNGDYFLFLTRLLVLSPPLFAG